MDNLSGVKAKYEAAYQAHGNSLKAIFIPKDRQSLRFKALTTHFRSRNFSVLDFGCGLGHLKQYLDEGFSQFNYQGVDIVAAFIQENQQNFSSGNFKVINSYQDITTDFDYIVLSGVFNMMYVADINTQKKIVQNTLMHLFEHSRTLLTVNFMNDQVDFQQPDAYHQNVSELHQFAMQQLSPRLTIDQSYMPYEFTLTVFKDSLIERPDNVYPALA